MAEEGTRVQTKTEDQGQRRGREALREGARGAQERTQATGRAVRDDIERSERSMQAQAQQTGDDVGWFAHDLAQEADRISNEIAENTSELMQDLSRLSVLPQIMAGSFHAAQEAATSIMRCAMETNLHILQEFARSGNPALILQAQQRVMRRVVRAAMEQGREALHGSRQMVEKAIGENEDLAYAGQRPQHQRGRFVGDIMSREVKLANPDQTVEEAARLMRESDTGALPVGENDRLVGMVTDRDIALRVVAEGKDPRSTHVRDAMSREVRYCFADETIEHVAQNMSEKQIRRLPVLSRDKRLVGIVSLGDISTRSSPQHAGQALRGVSQPA